METIKCTVRLNRLLIGCLLCALLLAQAAQGAQVRVAFIKDDAVLKDTIGLLREHGCNAEATVRFRELVQQYHDNPFELDLSDFPAQKDGFFSFGAMSRLVGALPHKLYETKHPYEFNCFDMVIRLGMPLLTSATQPDDLLSGLLAPYQPTNGAFTMVTVATVRDAFTRCYPEWYRVESSHAFDTSELDQRKALTASLFRGYVLPLSTTESELAKTVLDTLRTGQRTTNVQLPKTVEIVLVHEVNYPQRWFVTSHAGWLMKKKNGYAYVEKSGGTGPFVRLDVEAKSDLRIWFERMFQGAETLGYTHHFITFNVSSIETIDPPGEKENRW